MELTSLVVKSSLSLEQHLHGTILLKILVYNLGFSGIAHTPIKAPKWALVLLKSLVS